MSNPLFFEIPFESHDNSNDEQTGSPGSLNDFIDDEILVDLPKSPPQGAADSPLPAASTASTPVHIDILEECKRKRDAEDNGEDNELVQDGTPEPELVEIKSGLKKGKKRAKAQFCHRAERTFFTYSRFHQKPTIDELLEQMGSWNYELRQWDGCYERHRAERDDEGNVVEEGKWHIHLVGHICLATNGGAPNIKNARAFDIKIDNQIYHPNFTATRKLAVTW